jgi:xanthine dehydrogenase accessory factor
MIEKMINVLDEKEDVVIATILSKSGSAPREAGTKMLIHQDASIVGTIGGGLLEAMVIRLSASVFENKHAIVEDFELSDNDASAAGMVCGGEVRVLLEYVTLHDPSHANVYSHVSALKKSETDFIMITRIGKQPQRWICTQNELLGSANTPVSALVKTLQENFYRNKFHLHEGKETYMVEPFYNNDKLYVLGAGHVAHQVLTLAQNVGFYGVVIDDRSEFANKERYPNADEIHVISSYDTLLKEVKVSKNSYIVIVTRGHSYDKIVLKQALLSHAKYIGMIGSKTKRNHVYGELREEGFSQEELDAVHCPIGVGINAQTPEEIAVSIVAELILAKRS